MIPKSSEGHEGDFGVGHDLLEPTPTPTGDPTPAVGTAACSQSRAVLRHAVHLHRSPEPPAVHPEALIGIVPQVAWQLATHLAWGFTPQTGGFMSADLSELPDASPLTLYTSPIAPGFTSGSWLQA